MLWINRTFTSLSSLVLTFLITLSPAFAQANYEITPAVIIDIVGIIVGAVAIALVFNAKSSLGKLVQGIFNMLTLGITFQILALVYTLIFVRFKLFPVPGSIDIHHVLMFIGIIVFAITFYKLSKTFKNV